MLHPTQWMSLHYNHSTNNGIPDITRRIAPDGRRSTGMEGVGDDMGVTLNLIRDKLYLRANYYTTDAQNDLRNLPALAQRGERVLNALVEAGEITASEANARRSNANAVTFDRAGDGYEFEIVANPTSNWRIMANFTRSNVVETNTGDEAVAWADEQTAYWQTFDTNLMTESGRTIAQEIEDTYDQLDQLRSTNGFPSVGNGRNKATLFTRYSFSSGALKGFYIGGGYRYMMGSVTNRLPTGEPVLGKSRRYADALLGYGRRIWSDRARLKVQLNISNLFDDDEPYTTLQFADGTIRRFKVTPPRTFQLSTVLEF
jgi:outer membrane receptor for monomeric catechols